MRVSVAGVALATAVAAVLACAFARDASAQPTPPAGPTAPTRDIITLRPGQPVNQEVRPVARAGQPGALRRAPAPTRGPGAAGGAAPAAGSGHGDRVTSSGKLMALAFWLFALLTIGGAVFVITRRNLVTAVMGMVGTFLGLAAAYMMLFASFLAVIQVLVYAGAIMVLFVFVIMILNKPEAEPWGPVGLFGKGVAGLGMVYLAYRLVAILWGVKSAGSAASAPAPVRAQVGKEVALYDWGSTQAVGDTLFGSYLFPFEAVSILLLVAVVGAIAIARPLAVAEGGQPALVPDSNPDAAPEATP